METLHATLARTIVLYLAVLGVWGIALGIRGSGPSASYLGSLVIAELAAVAQGLVGVALYVVRPPEAIHILYGFALVFTLPLAATMIRDRQPRGRSMALGIAALFAAGLAIRGITTA